jgi:HlyD family secretion protein
MMIMTRSLVVSLEPARSRQTCAQIRAQKLKDTGAIALHAFDLAMNRVEVLEDQLASAKFALKVAEYELAQAKAALVHVEDDDTGGRLIEIRSPVTGRVLKVFEESARVVAADTPIHGSGGSQ